ncbi:hypothetical protein GPJ56_010278 [Histomonas meleagridis]|uniref:uncharacterized protein n=1 Tax=Histomonas meleagridis TaxID=135588 RepID=UPI003559B11C|nr:hypothetical protein GPJ56_010278 [Histomonas meleagridis]KAH0797147.1 hypothetical protein GO595_011040 [Histomonas meleagridis]
MSTLEQFEKIIIPSFNHARNGDVIIFKNPDVPENIKDIVRKASGNRLVPMVQRICFGHLAIAQNNERIEEEEDFDQLRSNIVPENSSRGDVIYLNVKKTLLPLLNLENVKKLEFDGNQIKSLSTAKALISYDDNDLVLNGLWLPKESPIILIMKDVNSDLSQAAKYLESSNHKIIRVNEDIEKIKSEISKI